MRPRGLVVFDLDGTLLRNGTCCELLARRLGYGERMGELERLTGEEEIIRARGEMAGWYEGRTIEELSGMLASATLAPGAAEGIALLGREGFLVGIASITWSFAVARFAAMLGVEHWLGTELGPRGEISHVWPADKPRWAGRLAREHAIPPEMVAGVGDSRGDIPLLLGVRHPFFVGSAIPAGLAGAEHMPDGDILRIAELIIERCALR